MTKIYAIANQKGGVGKTTTSVNLAASLAHLGQTVLLIDLDPQGNATVGSGIDKTALTLSAYEGLVGKANLDEILQPCPAPGYDLVPANADLTAAEVELLKLSGRERRLCDLLQQARHDFVIIDCPPSLNMLTVNGLVAAHSVIIPMQCEYYALEGLTALIDTISRVGQAANPRLKVEGILRTMYDARNSLTNEVSDQLHHYFGKRVYQTVIPRNVRLAEAPSHGQPILQYDRHSRGAIAYLALADELLRRQAAGEGS